LFLFTTRKPNSRDRRKTIQRILTIELPLKVTDIYHLKAPYHKHRTSRL